MQALNLGPTDDPTPFPWVADPSRHPLVSPQAKDIATRIFERITSGAYAFGTRMPAERELAVEFRETRATVRQALEFLATYDVVARRAGSGTFVTYRAPAPQRPQSDSSGAHAAQLTIHQLAE